MHYRGIDARKGILDNAVATRSQIDASVAMSASPSHNAAWVQICVLPILPYGFAGGSPRSGFSTPKRAGMFA